MRNTDSIPETASGWMLLKRVVSAAAFTTVLAIIPATMLPSTAMAEEFVEYFPEVQLVAATSESVNSSAIPGVEVESESLVYAVENLLHVSHSQLAADDQSASWNETANEDWQVSLSMVKTGSLATPKRWAMLRYTRAIW